MIKVVLTTFPDGDAAAFAAKALVGERLAACGTIIPGARSLYRWKGAIEEGEEVVVLFKTTADAYTMLEERLRSLHPYETPEILAFDAAACRGYADWVGESCNP